ncbi:MAG: gliding motility-associated C-terminal domain-containing protein [Bacteroidetes bacterium]|nr:gliding motility-associated C-terminal domain-containing protein [Bacteroidota bacterium]
MRISKIILILLIIQLLNINFINAQITSPKSDYTDTTKYNNVDLLGVDSIFVFYSPQKNGWPVSGSLTAKLDKIKKLDYIWKKFNSTTYKFDIDIKTELGVDSSIVNDLESGGYHVQITNGTTIDTSFVAWLYINHLKVEIEYVSTCENLELSGISGGFPFSYYDLLDSKKITINNGLKIEWSSDPEMTFNPNLEHVYTRPSYENEQFFVTVKDSFNCVKKNSIYILAIAVKPDFKALPDSSGEAPYNVQFENNSLNSELFHWVFFNDEYNIKNENDSLIDISDSEIPIDSIFYKQPGEYNVKLVVEGPAYYEQGVEKRCIDSLTKEKYINIDTSYIGEIPNVFTPNGDGTNDYFKIKTEEIVSIKTFEMFIISRWGRKVYQYKYSYKDCYNKSDYNKWEGWNGKINGDGGEASPGLYFYIINARGWNDKNFTKKGQLYLFKEKK